MVAKQKILGVIVGIIIINVVLMQLSDRLPDNEGDDNYPNEGDDTSSDGHLNITFHVTIPARTPDLDSIILHVGLNLSQMQRINDTYYQLEIDPHDYDLNSGASIEYGYSRGGFQPFAEELWIVFESWPHRVIVGEVSETNDIVEEWKWFPNESIDEIDIPSQAGNISVVPRDEFWKGVQLIDFWTDEWEFQYDSTIDRLKRLGYEWITLAPPWDIKSFDPPIITDTEVDVPAYPEEKLRNHIKIFKDAGFKVMLRIQVCCSTGDVSEKDATWWTQWFDQYNAFMQFHADISREEGVDALLFGTSLFAWELPLNSETNVTSNAAVQWQRLIATARTSNSLIGYDLFPFGAAQLEGSTSALAWPATDIDFFDDLDFLGISFWGDITNNTNPTQVEINIGTQRIFDHLEYTHDQLNLPMVFSGVAYASREGSFLEKGAETYFIWEDPTNIIDEYNSTQQAMIYESIMQQVAQRDFVKGLFPFGYWYVDAPLTVDDMSIRDKMAERILVNWFQYFPNSTSTELTLTTYNPDLLMIKSNIGKKEISILQDNIIVTYSTKRDYLRQLF
ncbi:MAG: hypothetical protein GPJ54_19210 [Candidatus Heimdallarchaeota archaeon]|nr:hypothetical protein [Candidatus Heimdallarchaeota archaeon]